MRLHGIHRLGFPVRDSKAGLVYAGGFFASYFVADQITSRLAGADESAAAGPSLLLASLRANIVVLVLLLAAVLLGSAVVWRFPERLPAKPSLQRWFCPWTELGHGRELRWLAVPVVVLMTWQASLYQYNYLLDRAHLSDRLLVVVLAAAALRRPIFLLAFVLQTRIIADQFILPYGTSAGQAIGDLLAIVLLVIAGGQVMYALTGRKDGSPVFMVLIAAVATHFFIPGRGKVLLNWLANEDLGNLASSGYAVGWLGQTDGGFASSLGDMVAALGLPLRLLTVIIELGALIVATNHRWFRWWLPLIATFHVANFLLLGFWFLPWIVLELALFILLSRSDVREWLGQNLSPGRAAMTAVAIGVFGPLLFHPAGLAWIDSPVAYGYRIEVVGETGSRYNLPSGAFAPFDQELSFSRLQLGPTRRLTGAYGVVVSTERLDELNQLEDMAEVLALETPFGQSELEGHAKAEDFLRSFVSYANDRADGGNALAATFDVVEPLPRFWTGRPAPIYRFQEPIVELEVFRLTSLRTDDGFQHDLRSVLMLDLS